MPSLSKIRVAWPRILKKHERLGPCDSEPIYSILRDPNITPINIALLYKLPFHHISAAQKKTNNFFRYKQLCAVLGIRIGVFG